MSGTARVVDSLVGAWGARDARTPVAVELLPAALASTIAGVLDADGVSMSLLSLDLRVPLGASGPDASTAERLQFTLGEGPCLDVMRSRQAVAYGQSQLARAWPAFARQFTVATAYRSVASVPLPLRADGGGGAVDLYDRQSDGALRFDLDDAAAAAEWAVDKLVTAQPPTSLAGTDDASKVPWLQATDTRRRIEVWVAIGAVSNQLALDTARALAALREWALAHGSDLDTVADEIAAGRLHPGLGRR